MKESNKRKESVSQKNQNPSLGFSTIFFGSSKKR